MVIRSWTDDTERAGIYLCYSVDSIDCCCVLLVGDKSSLSTTGKEVASGHVPDSGRLEFSDCV